MHILLVFCLLATHVSAEPHPHLFFANIASTPGYLNMGTAPWKTMLTSVNANSGNRSYYNALIWQVNGNATKAGWAADKLLHIRDDVDMEFPCTVGGTGTCVTRSDALEGYLKTYDWMQPYLSPAQDAEIRDQLANLSDACFYDLTHIGTTAPESYISFADYHGKMYPRIGLASIALKDYNKALPKGSDPSDWLTAGTTCLFVNATPCHGASKPFPVVYYEFGPSGFDEKGSYLLYYNVNMYVWIQALAFNYGINAYPFIKKFILKEIWTTLPSKHTMSSVANGQILFGDPYWYINLLTDKEKSEVLDYYQKTKSDTLLASDGNYDLISAESDITFVTFPGIAGITPSNPTYTSVLDQDGLQIFRSDWGTDATWMAFHTLNQTKDPSDGGRDTGHRDAMSFDYHAKEDAVMSDNGEAKYLYSSNCQGEYYGQGGKFHNTLLLSATEAGIPGVPQKYYWDSDVAFRYQSTNIEAVEGRMPFSSIEENNESLTTCYYNRATDTEPLLWTRGIIFPNREYFIVFDLVNSHIQRSFWNVFQLTSLNHPLTTDDANPEKVEGTLSVDSHIIPWRTYQLRQRNLVATNGNNILWDTTTTRGTNLETQVFSSPKSNISIQYEYANLGGYSLGTEAAHPIALFANDRSDPLNRATFIATDYGTTDYTVTDAASGALRIVHHGVVDRAGAGAGAFDGVATDADYSWSRENGSIITLFMRQGKRYSLNGVSYVSTNASLEMIDAVFSGGNVAMEANAPNNVLATILSDCSMYTHVKRNGAPYGDWECVNATHINVTLRFSSPDNYTIEDDGNGTTTTTTTTSTTVTTSSSTTTITPTTTTITPTTTTTVPTTTTSSTSTTTTSATTSTTGSSTTTSVTTSSTSTTTTIVPVPDPDPPLDPPADPPADPPSHGGMGGAAMALIVLVPLWVVLKKIAKKE
jgi:hypothetical protein